MADGDDGWMPVVATISNAEEQPSRRLIEFRAQTDSQTAFLSFLVAFAMVFAIVIPVIVILLRRRAREEDTESLKGRLVGNQGGVDETNVQGTRNNDGAEGPNARTHIHWDVNHDEVIQVNGSAADQDALAAPSGRGTLLAAPPGGIPAYTTGSRVEYYSLTQHCWLAAHLSAAFCRGQTGDPVATYSLSMRITKQRRDKIPLSQLRSPLKRGDLCEVYLLQLDTWAKAVVERRTLIRSLPTYVVQLDTEEVARVVGGAMVRRRFDPGAKVQLYRDAVQGWVYAEVVSPTAVDVAQGCSMVTGTDVDGDHNVRESTILPNPDDPNSNHIETLPPGADELGQLPHSGGRRHSSSKRKSGEPIQVWKNMPIIAADRGGAREVVPLYLLRPTLGEELEGRDTDDEEEADPAVQEERVLC